MSKKDKDKEKEAQAAEQTEQTPQQPAPEQAEQTPPQINWEEKYNAEHDAYLRLAAEFDNYRKRTVKEKEASYSHGSTDAVEKLLPVYDNLLRALKQETQDAAFKKGVEMTMAELTRILNGLGVEIFGAEGETFDPKLHNAVLHVDDENQPENTITQVFQQGFRLGERIIRFAMVQVAN